MIKYVIQNCPSYLANGKCRECGLNCCDILESCILKSCIQPIKEDDVIKFKLADAVKDYYQGSSEVTDIWDLKIINE